jgi:FHS family L-fucose permease-like MFS transporter
MQIKKPSAAALIPLVSVFFFWGFVAASNDILIPVFREKLNLEIWQSQIISWAFYIAYTVGSLIYLGISARLKEDLLYRIGYKNGLAIGLCISALGTLLFYPAAESASFPLMITGLFIVALGFSLQQTAANPLVIRIGDPAKGSQRLSLAGGINNMGTTVGPLLVSYAIFGNIKGEHSIANIGGVKAPYLILGAAFLVFALIFKLSPIPNKLDDDGMNSKKSDSAPSMEETSIAGKDVRTSVFHYPQLWMGMIAIFVYVGVEVATASILPFHLKENVKISAGEFAPYISLYWASLMIGRWTSSVDVLNFGETGKKIMRFVMPYLAFGFFLLVYYIGGHDLSPFWNYSFVILALIIANLVSKGNPARQLLIFSVMGIVSLIIGMMTSGMVSVYAFISVGLFCSTLWPCIYTLAIAGLGKHTGEGSGFLIMMIMGGGWISMLQGYLADHIGIQISYIVGVVCFAYMAWYAIRARVELKKQGIDYDQLAEAGH